ncbi:helix-turn-helix domain-containing protein [Halomicroarcula sp. GCM10025894]|uniref:helix-turn-helix domain-containing protein n=1 Tax=Halomicroarcula sp. GCM10025894 TaxID=3252673 RepID=UPI003608F499
MYRHAPVDDRNQKHRRTGQGPLPRDRPALCPGARRAAGLPAGVPGRPRGPADEPTAHGAAEGVSRGFFDWPRDVSGEELAESMGICPSTFHQHLRAGERKLLEAIFETW